MHAWFAEYAYYNSNLMVNSTSLLHFMISAHVSVILAIMHHHVCFVLTLDIYTSTVTTATSTIVTSVTTASAVTATAMMNTNTVNSHTIIGSTTSLIPSSTLSASSVVVLITITVVVIGIIVVWKRRKRQQHTKSEGIYYSTIDETMIKRPPTIEPGPVHAKINDEQDNKEPQYMDIFITTHSTKQGDKVTMQDNPAYSAVASEHQVMLQDNPAYSISYDAKQ